MNVPYVSSKPPFKVNLNISGITVIVINQGFCLYMCHLIFLLYISPTVIDVLQDMPALCTVLAREAEFLFLILFFSCEQPPTFLLNG